MVRNLGEPSPALPRGSGSLDTNSTRGARSSPVETSRLRRWFAGARAELLDADPLDLVLLLTLIYLLTKLPPPWFVKIPSLVLAAWGLLSRRARHSSGLWLLIVYCAAVRIVLQWWAVDNHVFLGAYWYLAVLVAVTSRDGARWLALNARLLIGTAFFFAALWKGLLSPDYLDGRFFRTELLRDQRFHDLSVTVGGQPDADYHNNKRELQRLAAGKVNEVNLAEPRSQVRLAHFATWWTLLGEGFVALCFLASPRWLLGRWRDFVLLGFCWTTYAVAPVIGFGWLLAVMGIAQCDPGHRGRRTAYLLSFVAILLLTTAPWSDYLMEAWLKLRP